MKATGIIRRIDDLGRVVIPKEIRRTLRIREGDPLEIFLDDQNGVVFRKYSLLNMSDDILRMAKLMAKFAGIEIAIYDTTCKLTGGQSYPTFIPEIWGTFSTPSQFENYIVYPILCDGERYGYVCSHSQRIAETTMIARYLAAACSN
jgi:AbrB family looped-hinge helix DNA binding protein